MVKVVGTEQMVILVDINAMRVSENILSPGVQKFTFLIEHDDGMFPPVEDIDSILAIDSNTRHFDK